MKSYLAVITMDIRLALRLRAVIFFNYLFPLIFFFTFAAFMGKDTSQMAYIVRMSVTLGVLGSGFFGAGIRAIQERELNILRRYKVTPITPAPLLVGSMITGWLIFIPSILILLLLARFMYHMPLPAHLLQFFGFVSLTLIAFRALGLVIAAVANNMQEGQILVQLFYFPLLLLGGATIPEDSFHGAMRTVHNFVPSTYLVRGMYSMMNLGAGLIQNWVPVVIMIVTAFVGGFIALKLFRWEKEEKIKGSAKWWVVVALLPFIVMGVLESFGISLFSRVH